MARAVLLSAADDGPDDDIRRRTVPRESTHLPPALCPDRGVATTVPACLGAPGRYRRDHNISDFLAKSVVNGFIFGLAITVAASQIPKLLGLPRVGQATPEQIWYLLRHLDQTNLWTLAIGIGALALIALVRRYAHRVPAGLVALLFGIIVVSGFNLDQYGVATVGEIRTGLPALLVPTISPTDLLSLASAAAGIVFLAGGESIASARSPLGTTSRSTPTRS